MNNIIKIILSLLALLILVNAEASPYCPVNKTSITYKPVLKTRQVIKKPNGFFKKIFKKDKAITEEYVELEKVVTLKLETKCCDGYEMSAMNLCIPRCVHGCPRNAKCVEPNLCNCQNGYVSAISPLNGTHFCEPICTSACPENGRCAAPNVCDCELGFHVIDSKCVERPAVTTIEPAVDYSAGEWESTTQNDIINSEVETNMPVVIPDGIQLDETQKIYLTTLATADDDDDFTLTASSTLTPCPGGFEFYNGDCRPILFPSNEFDCRFKPCFANAKCLEESGTCVCLPNFSLDNEDMVCIAKESNTTNVSLAREAAVAEMPKFLVPLLISLCVAGLICALLWTIVIWRRRRGVLDVENSKTKHELFCEYDNNSGCENPSVL